MILNLFKGKNKEKKLSLYELLIKQSQQYLFDVTCNPKTIKKEKKYKQKHFYVSEDLD